MFLAWTMTNISMLKVCHWLHLAQRKNAVFHAGDEESDFAAASLPCDTHVTLLHTNGLSVY
jgi:hypothetical protein